MAKHRDDEMSSRKGRKDDDALGPDEGTPRKHRSGDDGALGPDEGTPRSEAAHGTGGHEHAEFGGGEHKHSGHMPGTTDQPNG